MELIVNEIEVSEQQAEANRIRKEVFVQEQGVSEREEYDEFEASSRHYLAQVNGEAAGTARWRFTADGIKLERFAVLKPFRRQGVAAALLHKILQDTGHTHKIYLHAQVSAVGFYEKYGFVKTGAAFWEAGIAHYKMYLRH